MESVLAAVRNGADAVYLGYCQFSARSGAENFDSVQLKQAADYCHLHQVNVYLALNTILFDREFHQLEDTVRTAWRCGVDAFIVQDMGVLSALRRWCPDIPVHASTQMTVHTVSGAEALKRMGITRVVAARELSRAQIQTLAETGLEIEVFVHGALCMSVSGQCYMSALIGGRSGNKGSCAGTCRLPFSAEKGKTRYDLSLKDLCLAAHFSEFQKLGITSLKIEGRMKRPEYVAAAVQTYAGLKQGKAPDMNRLRAVFSRNGFTDGYYTNSIEKEMFGKRAKEDVIAATEQIYTELRESYRKEVQDNPIEMVLTVKRNEPVKLRVSCQGAAFEITGEIPQAALHHPLTEETAKPALAKLGGTAFFLGQFQAEIEPGLMVPKSVLNGLRRNAVERLSEHLAQRSMPFCDVKQIPLQDCARPSGLKMRARFREYAQIPQDKLSYLDQIYLPANEVLLHEHELVQIRKKIVIEPDRVCFSSEKEERDLLYKLYQIGFKKLNVLNIGHLELARNIGFDCYGSSFLNITNSYALQQYQGQGIIDTAVSFEMTQKQFNGLRTDLPLGFISYGHLPMMIVRNCPLKNVQSCGKCSGSGQLQDRKGNLFPVLCQDRRYSEVLNGIPLNLSGKCEAFTNAAFHVLYFTQENRNACRDVIGQFLRKESPAGAFTRGLYFRGIE